MVKRDKNTTVWVCRNRGCVNYKKPIKANINSKRV
nr:MAG TPA: interferon regulatory factor 2-binding protein [Caudoviricetes sp.]